MTNRSKLLITIIIFLSVIVGALFWGNRPEYLVHTMVVGSLLVYLVVRTQEYKANDTPDEFFLYDREMPRNQFVPTYVTTNIGLYSSIFYSAILAYYYGVAGMLYTVVAWFVGMFWFSRKIPALLPFFKEGSTLHEFIAVAYSKTAEEKAILRAWTSGVSSILYFASIGIEIKFAADMLAPSMGPLQSTAIAFGIAFVGLTYAYLSGYKGVVYTDKIQYYIMLFGAIITAIYAILIGKAHNFSFLSKAFDTYFTFPFVVTGPDPLGLLGMVLLLVLYQFCIMDMWQRCIAFSKTKTDAGTQLTDVELITLLRKKTFFDAIVPFLVMFIVWYMLGIVVLGSNLTTDQAMVLPAFLGAFNAFGPIGFLAKAIVVTGFVAAAISTVDGYLIATVQTFMYDIYGTVIVKGLSDKLSEIEKYQQYRFVNIAKIAIVIVGFLSVVIAFFQFGLMNFWTSMYSIMLSFFPAVYAAINMKADRYTYKGVRDSIMIGSCGALVLGIIGTFILNNSIWVSFAPLWAVGISAIIVKVR